MISSDLTQSKNYILAKTVHPFTPSIIIPVCCLQKGFYQTRRSGIARFGKHEHYPSQSNLMKTQFIPLIIILTLLNGCKSKKHLQFNNIPINAPLHEFVNKLVHSGFTEPQNITETQIKLHGDFLEQDCEINVFATARSKTVYRVSVHLPVVVHDSLQSRFESLQKRYASQYGPGESRYRQYRNPARFLFNEPRLKRKIQIGDITRYTTDEGVITIEVQDGYIEITYTDKLNNETRKKETEGREKNEPDDSLACR